MGGDGVSDISAGAGGRVGGIPRAKQCSHLVLGKCRSVPLSFLFVSCLSRFSLLYYTLKKHRKYELLLKEYGVICVFTIYKISNETSRDKLYFLKIRKLKRQGAS